VPLPSVEQTSETLVRWLRQRADEAGALGAVVGISGGVDSAAVAALSLRAFPETTLGVLMPLRNDPGDRDHALAVCRALGLPHTTVILDQAYDALVAALQASNQYAEHPVASANLRPRLRMTTLYYFANRLNRLVIGSGNRSEAYVGYFTKYGDGGVDVLPIAGLVKSQVRQLATALGVPKAIVERAPTAGLWSGQTDEDELGITYEVLDAYLLTGAASPEARARIEQLHTASEHKRHYPPIAEVPH
jgi:NAD+ synthase